MTEITCEAHLKCLQSLKELKQACKECESPCYKIYYSDIDEQRKKLAKEALEKVKNEMS